MVLGFRVSGFRGLGSLLIKGFRVLEAEMERFSCLWKLQSFSLEKLWSLPKPRRT